MEPQQMSLVVNMEEGSGLIGLRVQGELTLGSFVQGIDTMYGDARFDPTADILVEIEAGASAGLSSVEVSGILQALQSRGALRGTGRTALVASHEADLGMVRLLSHVLQHGPRAMQVFRSREEALDWLRS
jgi:hypothetical protein